MSIVKLISFSTSCPRWGSVQKAFQNVLTPLYGDQKESLAKIAEGRDRLCYLVEKETLPVGCLVMKKAADQEYEAMGVPSSVEIKTLMLFDSIRDSGRGLGSLLLQKAMTKANKQGASAVRVTVSEKAAPTAKAFFEKHGFVKVETALTRQYVQNVREFVFFKHLKGSALENKQTLADRRSATGSASIAPKYQMSREGQSNIQATETTTPSLPAPEEPARSRKRRFEDEVDDDRDRVRERDHRDREHDRDRDRNPDRDVRDRDRERNRDHENDRDRNRDRDRVDRDRGDRDYYERNRDRDYDRERNHRDNDRDRDRYRDNYRPAKRFRAEPQQFDVSIKKQYFLMIASGEKTAEGRIHVGTFSRVRRGDRVCFFCTDCGVRKEVVKNVRETRIFKDFRDMLAEIGLKKMLPNVKTLDEGISVYESIPRYKDLSLRHGVIALIFE